jgi:hypothetical protein
MRHDGLPQPGNAALLRPQQAADDAQQCGLAGAVGAGYVQKLAAADLGTNALKHVTIAAPHVDAVDRKTVCGDVHVRVSLTKSKS